MRALPVLLLVLAHTSLAAECLSVSSSRSLVELHGVIEHKPAHSDGSVEIFLELSPPICLQSVEPDGHPFKNENVTSIMLGVADDQPNLVAALRPHARVTVRGELWYPTFNDKSERIDDVILTVKEVRQVPTSVKPTARP